MQRGVNKKGLTRIYNAEVVEEGFSLPSSFLQSRQDVSPLLSAFNCQALTQRLVARSLTSMNIYKWTGHDHHNIPNQNLSESLTIDFDPTINKRLEGYLEIHPPYLSVPNDSC